MAAQEFALGVGLDGGISAAAQYDSTATWTLGCSISAEDIDASMREVYAADIELSGDIFVYAVDVGVESEVIDVIYLEISVCTCGFSSGEGEGGAGGGGGCNCVIDTEMSDTSENAVQNKVIKAYVDLHPQYIPIEDAEVPDVFNDYATREWVEQQGYTTPDSFKTINGESIIGEGDIVIEAGTEIDMDTEMSDYSVNPVQNKVIKAYVDLHPQYEAIGEAATPDVTSDYATKEWVSQQGYITECKSYTHTQNEAAATWYVDHQMGKYPSVTVVDSAGTMVFGDVTYNNENQVTITFTAAFSGKAYLN